MVKHLFTRSEWIQLFNRAREECLREVRPRAHKTDKGWVISRPKTELTNCIKRKLNQFVQEKISSINA